MASFITMCVYAALRGVVCFGIRGRRGLRALVPSKGESGGGGADAPFAFSDPAMGWKGYSVDLLTEIAGRVNLEIEYVPYATLPALYDGLDRGEVDVGIGNILVTSRGVERLEFSQPMLDGGYMGSFDDRCLCAVVGGLANFRAAIYQAMARGVRGGLLSRRIRSHDR